MKDLSKEDRVALAQAAIQGLCTKHGLYLKPTKVGKFVDTIVDSVCEDLTEINESKKSRWGWRPKTAFGKISLGLLVIISVSVIILTYAYYVQGFFEWSKNYSLPQKMALSIAWSLFGLIGLLFLGLLAGVIGDAFSANEESNEIP